MSLTEYQIQNKLAQYLQYKKNHSFITPNTTMIFGWECDLISITKSNFIHEFEIKRSKADFKADSNKHRKHLLLENQNPKHNIPNYFWYVFHDFEFEINDIPEYAGLIYVNKNDFNYIKIIKNAPRISKRKVSDYQKQKCYEAITFRYWNERRKNGDL